MLERRILSRLPADP